MLCSVVIQTDVDYSLVKPAQQLIMQMQIFCVYGPCKESISKKMNNDNDFNLHGMIKLSGWLH